jgi:TRL-like protein family
MKYLITLILLLSTSCSYTDTAKNLRYADNRPVSISDIKFQELQAMKHGKSCGYSFLFIPMFGNRSLITAAESGNINNVKLIGETGFWAFPFSQTCTIVYGS